MTPAASVRGRDGVLNVDKPQGLTSHDVVARVRRLAGQRRVGHAGTLDPLATGVLVICLGRATRLVEYIADAPKRYRATVRFGVETDTWDAEGQVMSRADWRHLRLEDVETLLAPLRGSVWQVPPMYSALKRDGQPLYRLARQGLEVEREARQVEIHSLEVLAWEPPDLVLDVSCSKGTYVRSLAHDLGGAAGVGAHLAALRRLAVGAFSAAQAVPLARLEAGEDWARWLLRPAEAISDMRSVVVDAEVAQRLVYGQAAPLQDIEGNGPLAAYTTEGGLIAILQRGPAPGIWRPQKVFDPPA